MILNLNKIISFLPRFETVNLNSMYKCIIETWKANDGIEFIKTGNSIKIYNINNLDLSFAIRVGNCIAIIKSWLNNFILGMGLSFVRVATDCNYVRLLAETGIIGFLVYLIVIRTVLKNVRNINNIFGDITKIGSYTLLLTAMFIDIFEASKIIMFYWLLVGVSYKVDSLKNRRW